jgi:hypothetical protein
MSEFKRINNPNVRRLLQWPVALLGAAALAGGVYEAGYSHGQIDGDSKGFNRGFKSAEDAHVKELRQSEKILKIYARPFTTSKGELVANITGRFDIACEVTGKDPDDSGPLPAEVSYKVAFHANDGDTVRGYIAAAPDIITNGVSGKC